MGGRTALREHRMFVPDRFGVLSSLGDEPFTPSNVFAMPTAS
jgi:hypothetical protein